MSSFHGPTADLTCVVTCKGCQQVVSAGVEALPDRSAAIVCPVCREHRQYRASEVYKGRLGFGLIRGGKA